MKYEDELFIRLKNVTLQIEFINEEMLKLYEEDRISEGVALFQESEDVRVEALVLQLIAETLYC